MKREWIRQKIVNVVPWYKKGEKLDVKNWIVNFLAAKLRVSLAAFILFRLL
jgi:hypothetical protein